MLQTSLLLVKSLNKTETPIFLSVVCSLFPKAIFLTFIKSVLFASYFLFLFYLNSDATPNNICSVRMGVLYTGCEHHSETHIITNTVIDKTKQNQERSKTRTQEKHKQDDDGSNHRH